ncbi:MAG: hypothetical protein ACREJM_02500 [Candidatus Saccharimonadales bacterium]
MKRQLFFVDCVTPLIGLLMVAGCGWGGGASGPDTVIQGEALVTVALPDARRDFKTVLRPAGNVRDPVPQPPSNVFNKIIYESPVGPLAAYLTPDPHDGQKHPAIVWITGGDCNSIGDVWSVAPRSNDQTAAAFRKAGIARMCPALSGGHDNPVVK